MKKTKRIFAIILSVIIMAIVPLNAFASNIADSIELTVDAQPGMNLYNYEEYITINTPGLTFSDEFYVYEIYEEESYYRDFDNSNSCYYWMFIFI